MAITKPLLSTVLISFWPGSYGSLARFPSISRITKVNENTVIGATGDYADFQFVKDVLELIT